ASLSFLFTDPSGFIFDVQSNTVMAQGGTFENMKEKVNVAVRAIVPNRSNNEIVLVLQHFDNCVDRTVQAFMEGNASEVLKEWTVTGKKKNKKKKTKPKPQAESSPGLPDPGKLVSTEEEQSANSEKGGINGFHVNGCAHDTESVDSLSEGLDALSIDARELEDCESAAPDMPDRTAVPELENGIADFDTKSLIMHPSQSPSSLRQRPEQRNASRSLSRSAASNSTPASLSITRLEDVPVSPGNKKLGSNIEKSVKDLQRCTVSLARYRVVVKEEMDASIKKMKQVFAELQSSLMDREVALLAEMDKVKAEAMEILVSRQKKAEALKKMTDVAVRMSEEQLVELRADIKHFVSERKYDEDLGRVARFTCDLDALKKSIASFGQVSHPKNSYSTRSRCSSVTAASLSGPSGTSAPSAPTCASASAASLTTASKKPSAEAAAGNATGRPPQPSREVTAPARRCGKPAPSGPRSQGQRHVSPPVPGRHNNGHRHRHGPGQAHGRRQTSSPAASAASPGQTQPAAASARHGPPPAGTETKGLPQRKPRASRQEGASS
ncbi:SPAS2 protein, partial [Fregetta grallaria]|nr:SPAS2 protein [Fregetta grallaria]